MNPNSLRIAIAEDHVLVRQAIAKLLNSEGTMHVVVEADNGRHLLDQLKERHVDIVLLDIQMPVMDGRLTLKRLRSLYPHIKVIILTGLSESGFEYEYLHEGAAAFLSKFDELETMLSTISNIFLEPATKGSVLSKRELEIMRGIVQKHPNGFIAQCLHLSVRTVENHRYNIFKKTGTKNADQLSAWAIENRMF